MTRSDPSSDKSSRDPRSAPSSLRVLVVDDERDTVLMLQALLRSEGYETRGAASAGEMWKVIDAFDPDVVLLDIGLPDRSGYEVARRLRECFGEKRPKLIAVTGWNKGSDKILAQIAGFDHHIGKPYDPNQLLALVASVSF